MESFLTFLSNNYIYFLIAAGVLFFALIGFLIDLKKKKDGEVTPDLTSIPDVTTIPEDMNLGEVVDKNGHLNSQTEVATDEFNPAPPMPQEEPIQDIPANDTPVYIDPTVNQNIPVQPQQPVQNIETVVSNDQINQ